jgi:hypothetical protein
MAFGLMYGVRFSVWRPDQVGYMLVMTCGTSSSHGGQDVDCGSILKNSDDGVLHLKESCFWTLSII